MKTAAFVSLSVVLGALGAVSAQAQDTVTARGEGVKAARSTTRTGDYTGMWQGMLRDGSGTHRVALDVGRGLGEGMVANVVTSVQSPYSVLVDTFEARDHHITLNMKTAGTGFTGTSNAGMTEVRGTWKQDGKSTPLTLRRVDANGRTERENVTDAQSQMAGAAQLPSLKNGSDENPSDPHRSRKQSAFSIAPPRWFWWYDWTPQIGNQDRPYGTYYW